MGVRKVYVVARALLEKQLAVDWHAASHQECAVHQVGRGAAARRENGCKRYQFCFQRRHRRLRLTCRCRRRLLGNGRRCVIGRGRRGEARIRRRGSIRVQDHRRPRLRHRSRLVGQRPRGGGAAGQFRANAAALAAQSRRDKKNSRFDARARLLLLRLGYHLGAGTSQEAEFMARGKVTTAHAAAQAKAAAAAQARAAARA